MDERHIEMREMMPCPRVGVNEGHFALIVASSMRGTFIYNNSLLPQSSGSNGDIHEGASMITWTTLDPCTCLSESDSQQSTNFEFLKKKIINISKTYKSTKSSNLCSQKQYLTIYIF